MDMSIWLAKRSVDHCQRLGGRSETTFIDIESAILAIPNYGLADRAVKRQCDKIIRRIRSGYRYMLDGQLDIVVRTPGEVVARYSWVAVLFLLLTHEWREKRKEKSSRANLDWWLDRNYVVEFQFDVVLVDIGLERKVVEVERKCMVGPSHG